LLTDPNPLTIVRALDTQSYALVAQLDRVLGYEPSGRRFESSRVRHKQNPAHKAGFFMAHDGGENLPVRQLPQEVGPSRHRRRSPVGGATAPSRCESILPSAP